MYVFMRFKRLVCWGGDLVESRKGHVVCFNPCLYGKVIMKPILLSFSDPSVFDAHAVVVEQGE